MPRLKSSENFKTSAPSYWPDRSNVDFTDWKSGKQFIDCILIGIYANCTCHANDVIPYINNPSRHVGLEPDNLDNPGKCIGALMKYFRSV